MSRLLYECETIVLIAAVGRFRKWRDLLREEIPNYMEIYLKCPLKVRLERDVDAKYERHKDYFYIYEEPTTPDLKREIESLGHPVEILDSDEVPRSLTKDLSPDWKTRQIQKCTNLIYIAKLLYKHDIIVLISSVGRFQQMRANARNEIEDFVEVYLKCSQDVRLKRDEKAKYKRYPSTIHYYEEPVNPEIIIETDQCSSECSAKKS